MKLIIAGATGYVATELIRQSLRRPDVTSVVALARKTVAAPADVAGANAAKLTSVVVKDYETGPYDDEATRKALAGADACIWTVAITPSKSSAYPFKEVRRICQSSTLAGLRAIHGAGSNRPFRFLYMSGIAAERDQTKKPPFKPEYSLMRATCSLRLYCGVLVLTCQGQTENDILAYAADHREVEPIIVKPGLITSNRLFQDWIMAPLVGVVAGVPNMPLSALATVMLDQAINGAKADTILAAELVQMGKDLATKQAKQ
ncbi:hypothetical protein SCUCBS95973_005813 [Sporothrix curviconia]|uniref:NAD(P)-binding domain-containing protein n=1 Tax=Sporothrix curviconia TaxID=1260050 RepID=A0ABP0C0W7_9PEZI